jgi:hypothetical protein
VVDLRETALATETQGVLLENLICPDEPDFAGDLQAELRSGIRFAGHAC